MAYVPPLNGGRLNASISGNTAGVASLLSTGTLYLAGGSNITLSQNGASVSIIGTSGGGGTLSMYGLGNTTQGTSGTFDARSVSLNGLGAMSVGYSGGSVQLSAPVASSVSATGILSVSANGNTVSMGVPAYSAGISAGVGNTSGTTGFATNQLVLAGGNNVTLSQATGAGGNTISISAGGGGGGGSINFSASNTSANLASVTFSNSNGVSFGLNAGVITASHNALTAQSVTANFTATSSAGSFNTTLTSTGTYDMRSIRLAAMGNLSAGYSNGSIVLSGSAPSGSSLSATGAVSLSTNGGTISIGAPAFSGGVSTLGNSAGNTGTVTNRLIFAGGNNITLSQSTNASGATVSINGGAGGGGGGAISAGGTNYTNGVSFSPAGALTMSTAAGSTLTMSVPAVSQLTYTGAVSMASAGSNISIGAPVMSLGMNTGTAGGGTGGTSGTVSNGLALAAGSNITLSQSTNASGATVSIYGGAGGGGGGGTLSMYGLGNTTQSSSATIGVGSVSLNGLGAMSVGYSGGSVQLSAPATSSLSVTGALSLTTNGSTISLGAPAASSLVGSNGISLSTNGSTITIDGGQLLTANQMSYFENIAPSPASASASSILGTSANLLLLQPLAPFQGYDFPGNMTVSTAFLNMSGATATSISGSHNVSVMLGIYTMANSTQLSLINSAITTWSRAANASNVSNYSGARFLSIHSSQWSSTPAFSAGVNYWWGVEMRSGGNALSLSWQGQWLAPSGLARNGTMGVANTGPSLTQKQAPFLGVYATSGIPTTIGATTVQGSHNIAGFMPHLIFNNLASSF